MSGKFRPLPAAQTPVVNNDGTLREYEYWFGLDKAARTGTPGPAGPQGPAGPTGPQGPQGDQGPQGAQGDPGLTGATGPKGDTGDTGPAGANGADGADGADGVGVPAGGTTGQVLSKVSGTDYDTEWTTPSGTSATVYTNSLAADVNLNNTANYFTGPTVSQGTSGRWFAQGTVSVRDMAGAATFAAQLWDGTTVIASGVTSTSAAAGYSAITLAGVITNPAGDIRISVRDFTSTSGVMRANGSALGKDSTLTVISL